MDFSKSSTRLISLGVFFSISLGVHAQAPKSAAEQQLMAGFPPVEEKLVTKANWLTPPYNRYAYLHTRELFPSKPFTRSTSQSKGFEKEIVGSLSHIKMKGTNGKEMLLDDFLKAAYSDGFVVLHHGKIVYERYWNGATAASPHTLFSITKSFPGTLVGILEARGLIDYEKTVAHYLPELKESGYGDATIRQMMDMEVGVAWDESPEAIADPNGVFQRYVISSGFAPSAQVGSAYAFLPTMKKANEHGEQFQYVAPVTDALGWLLDGWGNALSTGGLNLTPRDLARFGLIIQQGGHYAGERIVSEEFIADSRFNGDRETFKKGEKDSIQAIIEYDELNEFLRSGI